MPTFRIVLARSHSSADRAAGSERDRELPVLDHSERRVPSSVLVKMTQTQHALPSRERYVDITQKLLARLSVQRLPTKFVAAEKVEIIMRETYAQRRTQS